MVDYTYYKETFGGTLSEAEFHKNLPKAAAYLRGVTHGRALPEETSVLFCWCELVEVFSEEGDSTIAAESCDGFHVTYDKTSLSSAAWKIVSVYLAAEGVLYGGGDI